MEKHSKHVRTHARLLPNSYITIDSNICFLSTQVNVLDRYDVTFQQSSSSIHEVKRTIRQKIAVLTETITTKIKKIDVAVNSIIEDIVNETQKMQTINAESEHHENYALSVSQFQNLRRLIRVSDILRVRDTNHNANSANAYAEHLNTTFEDAKKRMQMEKQNVEQGLHKCWDREHIAFQIAKTTTSVKTIISETVSETKVSIRELVTRFGKLMNEYEGSSADSQLTEKVRQYEEETSLSEELKTYLEDTYANRALAGFTNILNECDAESLEEVKRTVSDSFAGNIDRIQSDMDGIKTSLASDILEKLSQGIATIERIAEGGSNQLEEEELTFLASTTSLIKAVQSYLKEVDTHHQLKVIKIGVAEARESIKQETVKAVDYARSVEDKNRVKEELINTVDRFDVIYTDLRNTVHSKLNECSINFLDIYKSVMENLQRDTELEVFMRNTISGKTSFPEDQQYTSALSFIKSGDYTSSLVRQLVNAESASFNDNIALEHVQALSSNVVEGINRMETAVQYISYILEEGTELVKVIGSSRVQQLNQQQIRSLAKTVSLSQTLITIAIASSKPDFKAAQSTIDKEYTKAKLAIDSAEEDEIVEEAMLEALESYDQLFIDLRETAKVDFTQTATDFSALSNSIIESNAAVRNIWQEVERVANSNEQSREYKSFQDFLRSESYQSSFSVRDIYEQLSESDTTLERLASITTDIKRRVTEMEKASLFVAQNFQTAAEILRTVNKSNAQLTREQISKLGETILVYRALSSSESEVATRSLEDTISSHLDEDFSKAELSINEEYENALNAINAEEANAQQIVASTVDNFNTIYNRLSHSVTTQWYKIIDTYTASCTSTSQNLFLKETLGKYDYSALQNDAEYQRFIAYITDSGYKSADVVKQWYKTTKTSSSTVQLQSITTKINQQISAMKFASDYLQNSFQNGVEIVQSLNNQSNTVLEEEQLRILAINDMITKTVKSDTNNLEMVSETGREIDKELTAAVDQITTTTDESATQQIINKHVQTSDGFFNTMKESVSNTIRNCSETFKQSYESAVSAAESAEMRNILENVSKTRNSADSVTRFEKWLTSETYRSKSAIADMFNSIGTSDESFVSIREKYVKKLTTLSSYVHETIIETEKVVAEITESFGKGEDILMRIRNKEISRLTEEQMQILSQNHNFIKIVETSMASNSIDFSQVKTGITDEYRKIISNIKDVSDAGKVQEMVEEGVEKSQNTYNDFRLQVAEQMNKSCSDFNAEYKTVANSLQTAGVTEKVLQNASVGAENDEYFEKCKSFITSRYFRSNSAITETFQEIQRDTTRTVLDHVETLSTRVSESLEQMEVTSKYVTDAMTASHNLLEKLQTRENVQFTREEIRTLSLSKKLAELVENAKTVNVAQSGNAHFVQKTEFTDAMKMITSRYDITVNTIRYMNDQQGVKSAITKAINDSEAVYNGLKEKVCTTIAESCAEMEKLFETEDLRFRQLLLENRQVSNSDFRKFESYITGQQLKSDSVVAEAYNDIHNRETASYASENERNVEEMKTLSRQISARITEMREINEYIAENLSKASALLKSSQEQKSDFTEEELSVLSIARAITKLATVNLSGTRQSSTKVDFTDSKSAITEGYESAITTIRSTHDEKTIQDTVTETVQHSEIVYNELKSKVQSRVYQTCVSFKNDFDTTLAAIQNTKNGEILQNVVIDHEQELIQNLKSYFTDTESNSAISTMYRNLQQDVESSSSVAERCTEHLTLLQSMVVQKIDKMEETDTYVTQTLQRGHQLLQTIRDRPNIQLSDQQISLLSVTRGITEAMDAANALANTSEEVDFANAKTTISKHYENVINEIRTVQDEETIRNAVAKTVQNTDHIYADLRSQVRAQMAETCSDFEQNYRTALSALQQNENTKEALRNVASDKFQTDFDFQRFKSYVSSRTFYSSAPIAEMFNQSQQNVDNSDIRERSIRDIETLSSQVDDDINQMQKFKKYVQANVQKAVQILQQIQNDSSVQLTEQQLHILSLGQQIAELVLQQRSNEAVTDISGAKMTVTRDLEKTLDSIRTAQNEEGASEIVAEYVRKNENVYNEIREQIRAGILESSSNFQKTYESVSTNLQQYGNAATQKILQKVATTRNETSSESFKILESLATGGRLTSNTAVSDLYHSVRQQSAGASAENYVDKNIRQLRKLNEKLIEKFDQMEEIGSYVADIQQRGMRILERMRQNVELTEEQIRILSDCNQISQLASVNLRNNSGKQPQNTELDLLTTKEAIATECGNAIEAISSTTDERSATEIVRKTVQKSQQIYNNLQTNIRRHIAENCDNFESDFKNTVSNVNQQNSEIRDLLQNIKTRPEVADTQIEKVVSYIAGNNFSSSTAVTDIFADIQQNRNSMSDNAQERSIEYVQNLNTLVAEKLAEMNDIDQYVAKNLQEGCKILESIKVNNCSSLTEEQIHTLSINTRIIRAMRESTPEQSTNGHKVNSSDAKTKAEEQLGLPTDQNISQHSTNAQEVDFSTSKSKTVQQSSTEVDQNTPATPINVREIDFSTVKSQTEKQSSTTVDHNAPEQSKKEVDFSKSKTEQQFSTAVNQNIPETSTNVREIDSSAKSTTVDHNKPEQSTNAEEVDFSTSKTKTEQQFRTTTDQNIPQQSTDVQEVDFSAAKSKTAQQFGATIDSIRSTNDATIIEKVVKECVENNEATYNDLETQTGNKIAESSYNFRQDYDAVVTKMQQRGNTEMEKMLQEANNKPVKNDAEFMKFETYIAGSQFKSNSAVTEMYNNIQQTDNQAVESIAEQNIRQVKL